MKGLGLGFYEGFRFRVYEGLRRVGGLSNLLRLQEIRLVHDLARHPSVQEICDRKSSLEYRGRVAAQGAAVSSLGLAC